MTRSSDLYGREPHPSWVGAGSSQFGIGSVTTVHQLASRRLRRTALVAMVFATTPVVAEPPKRPIRLPGVQASQPNPTPPATTPTRIGAPVVEAIPGSLLSTQQVKARAAAMKTAPIISTSDATTKRWLPTTTANASFDHARRKLSDASRSYEVGAWLSAESDAWEALRHAAEGIDLAAQARGTRVDAAQTATAKLRVARRAIIEARDFSRWTIPQDTTAISRTIRSHSTTVLRDVELTGVTATAASACYLDAARVALASLASRSVEAAQAMDLLAATFLTRNEPKQLPSPTALCLRRAALQGQPQNASLAFQLGSHLASVGLLDEAEWALQHSLSIVPDPATASALATVRRSNGNAESAEQILTALRMQTPASPAKAAPKVPLITQLSPEQFAAVSPQVMNGIPEPQQPAARVASVPLATESAPSEPKKPGAIRRFFGSLKSVW